MTEVPAPQNTTATIVNSIMRVAVIDIGVRAARAAAIAEAPWLAWPVISQVFDFVLNKFATWFYVGVANEADFAIIDSQTNSQAADVNRANAELLTAEATNDPVAIAAAKTIVKARLKALFTYDGEARP